MPQTLVSTTRTMIRRLLCGTALLACGASQALELNEATEAQLDGLRGLGPSSTARILQAREAGPFRNWADFMARVKGIKPATAAKFSAQGLTVQGAPYTPEAR
nr:helix-hairpin-helix domain-containing protein [uncultured Rhodoferax sp.]